MSKSTLKEKFSTGKKPSGEDFATFIDESVQDFTEYYKKSEVDAELKKKANSSSLADKADKSTVDDLVIRVEALEGGGE